MNFETGTTFGDYQIVGVVGAGGMGKVYKVRNVISERIEAMKVLSPDLVTDPDLADRFLREIKVHAGLEHPNIAALRTALRVDNQFIMVMELVEGITLEERARQGRIPVNEAVEYTSQVLAALSYAHRRGVIHRDIKPANMMLTPGGTVKLLDFGIAKGAGDRKLTMTGTTMGSLYYMSPEQIRGTGDLDARSDLYSVGVSLYELVTGKRPFDGDSQFAIMSAHLEKEPVPPLDMDPTLPKLLNDLILLSVSKDPARRFQTADAFRHALASLKAAPPPVPVTPDRTVTPPQAAPAPAAEAAPVRKSRRGLWITVGAFCTALAVIGVVQFGPVKKTGANVNSVAQDPPAATAPAAAIPAETPPPATPSAPPASEPVKTLEVRPAPVPAKSAEVPPKAAAPTTVPPSRADAQPVAPAPQSGAPAQASAPPAVPAPPQAATRDAAAARAELQQVRESLVGVSARAASVHATLQNLQRSQAASGLGMRSDWVQSATLMDSYLKGSNDALGAGDAKASRDFLEKAERLLERLEKALNK